MVNAYPSKISMVILGAVITVTDELCAAVVAVVAVIVIVVVFNAIFVVTVFVVLSLC